MTDANIKIDVDVLYDLYIAKNLTRNKVAEKLGVKPRYVKFLLSKYGLKKDSKNKALNNKGGHTSGLKWFNNGIVQTCAKVCPKGFTPGRLQSTKDKLKGKHNISEEARKVLSINATKRFKGKKISDEHRLKISCYYKTHVNPKKNIPCSEETKAKISKTLTGRKQKHPIQDIINTLSERDCRKYLSPTQVIDFTALSSFLNILNNQYTQELIQARYDKLSIKYKAYTSTSLFENKVYNYIKSIYTDVIITNDKKTLYPYELDILLPKLNVAFECNGIYWHCSEVIGKKSKSQIKLKDSYYHKNKIKLGMSKNIFIVNIWEDEWNNHQECVKEYIRKILQNGILPTYKNYGCFYINSTGTKRKYRLNKSDISKGIWYKCYDYIG